MERDTRGKENLPLVSRSALYSQYLALQSLRDALPYRLRESSTQIQVMLLKNSVENLKREILEFGHTTRLVTSTHEMKWR